jgi:methionyl-tRNA synthetase
VNRTLKFAVAKYQSTVPPSNDPPGPLSLSADDEDAGFIEDVNRLLQSYNTLMDSVRIREGLQVVMQLSARGNLYLQGAGLNNALLESNPQRCALVISRAINLIWVLSALVGPFMPAVEQGILRQLNCPPRTVPDVNGEGPSGFGIDLLGGHVLGKTEYLFTKIEENKAEIWRTMFGSTSGNANAAPGDKETKGKGKPKKEKVTSGDGSGVGGVGVAKEKVKKVKEPKAKKGEKKDGTPTETPGAEGESKQEAEVKKDAMESTSEIPVPSAGSGTAEAQA